MLSTVEAIKHLNYPDFVAYIGQKNTPPGGLFTIRRWVEMAGIQSCSHLLDLACSTGFSSRNCVKLTGSTAEGIDISTKAVQIANEEATFEILDERLHYVAGDATKMPFADSSFTHILGGCNFAFIQDRNKALAECDRVLQPKGKLCIANFYYDKEPDIEILHLVKRAVGFRPEPYWTHEWWGAFFTQKFTCIAEEHYDLPVVDEVKLEEQVQDFIYNHSETLKHKADDIKESCFNKLFEIRKVLNRHRRFQKSNISIWETAK